MTKDLNISEIQKSRWIQSKKKKTSGTDLNLSSEHSVVYVDCGIFKTHKDQHD